MSNSNYYTHALAIELLEQILAGDITPEEARVKWPKTENDKLMDVAFHELYHFEDDSDIRDKDTNYASWQTKRIQDTISNLRSSLPNLDE